MTNKNIITLFSGVAAILLLVMLPVDAEAYYFEPIAHDDITDHLESSENIDFTPSYDINTGLLTITFGENPDMDAESRELHLIAYRADTEEKILDEMIVYSDGMVVTIIAKNISSDTIIYLIIKAEYPTDPGDFESHIGFKFNLFWTLDDEGSYLSVVQPIVTVEEKIIEKNHGGCADCTAPTIGLNSYYKRVVDNGFSYNGNSVQVEKWHTPFPLITAKVGKINTVEIIVYENHGVNNMELVQFGLGATAIGEPLNDLEVLIEVYLETFGTNGRIAVEKVIIKDRDNLIELLSVFAVADMERCKVTSDTDTCVKVTLEYSYREPTINNIMVVNVRDKPGNSQNFYLNDGVNVVGESLNEPPTYIIQNRLTHQQTEDFTLTLTRTDKVNHIWEDKYGIEYLNVSQDRFDRITPNAPIECNDKPLSEMNVPNRNNCNFRATMISLWK